jgi:hypothetical protein
MTHKPESIISLLSTALSILKIVGLFIALEADYHKRKERHAHAECSALENYLFTMGVSLLAALTTVSIKDKEIAFHVLHTIQEHLTFLSCRVSLMLISKVTQQKL